MDAKTFRKYLDRDQGCYVTGSDWEPPLSPQHRKNRGMGGSKLLDVPSNIIVFDSIRNGLIESDEDAAREARKNGWKLARYHEPTMVPCFHARRGWLMLDDDFNAIPAKPALVQAWLHEVELQG